LKQADSLFNSKFDQGSLRYCGKLSLTKVRSHHSQLLRNGDESDSGAE